MNRKSTGSGSAIKSLSTPKRSRRASSGLFKLQFDSASNHGSKSRTSLFGSRASMQSTVGGRGGKRWSGQGAATLKDPRNLMNRGVQRKLLEDLLSFLQEYSYPGALTLKTLQAPTKKDCENLFAFLLELLIPGFKIKRFEDDIPRVSKQLHYPFTISKSTMFSIGSLHTWPALLGALNWLVDLIRYCSSVDPHKVLFGGNIDEDYYQSHSRKIFLEYCCKSYQEYVAGEIGPDENDDVLFQNLFEQAGVSLEEYEAVQERVRISQMELASLQEEPDYLAQAEEERAMLRNACEDLERNIIESNHSTSALQQKIAGQDVEMRSMGIEIDSALTKSQLDANRNQQKITLEKLRAEQERMDNTFYDQQMGYSKLYDKVDTYLQDFKDDARQLMLDKTIEKMLNGKDLELKMDPEDFKLNLKKVMNDLYYRLCDELNKTESLRIREAGKLERILEASSEREDSEKQLELKIAQIEKEIEFKKESMAADQRELTDRIAKLELENDEKERENETLVRDQQKLADSLKEEVKRTCEEFTRQEHNYSFFLKKVVEAVSQHQSIIQEKVTQVRLDAEEDMNELLAITPPRSKLLDLME